jgi:hypothetical protein
VVLYYHHGQLKPYNEYDFQYNVYLHHVIPKILEGISAFWPGGTAPAYISMIIGKIASGIITKLIEESKPGDEIQSKANEIREGMLAIFDATKKKIDQMIVDPEHKLRLCIIFISESLLKFKKSCIKTNRLIIK